MTCGRFSYHLSGILLAFSTVLSTEVCTLALREECSPPVRRTPKQRRPKQLFTEVLFPYGPRPPKPQKGAKVGSKAKGCPFFPFSPLQENFLQKVTNWLTIIRRTLVN